MLMKQTRLEKLYLNLENTDMSDDGIKKIAKSLKNLQNLRKLDLFLGDNWIDISSLI